MHVAQYPYHNRQVVTTSIADAHLRQCGKADIQSLHARNCFPKRLYLEHKLHPSPDADSQSTM